MSRLKRFEKLTNIDSALSTFLEKLKMKRLESVSLPLSEASGRVTAEDIRATTNLPSHDRSAVDGYALMAQSTFETSQYNPRTIPLTDKAKISPDEAKPVFTGNPLPFGADAVVMLEHTKKVEGKIEVWTALTPGKNVSKKGEDIQKGEVAVKAGTRLNPPRVALLAALQISKVNVVRKPKVAILCTGNELTTLEQDLKPNQIVDSNSWIISGLCLELGAEPIYLGPTKDNIREINAKIQEGITAADVVITTGGTSVGVSDLVPDAINQLGTPGVVVHGMSMRPGMPTGLAIIQHKPIFILSGNPVAAMVGFEVFSRPTLLRLMGIISEPRPMLKARLTRNIASSLGSRVFLRVTAYEKEGEFFAEPVRVKGSGVLTTLTRANGFVLIPENREGIKEGESVVVHLYDKLRKA